MAEAAKTMRTARSAGHVRAEGDGGPGRIHSRTKATALKVLVLVALTVNSSTALGWSNSVSSSYSCSGSWNSMGIHDYITDRGYRNLKTSIPASDDWIAKWYSNGKDFYGGAVNNSDDDAFIAWNDDPDFELQDWAAHNMDHHVSGYHGIQPPAHYSQRAVEHYYNAAVRYLANWIAAGKPSCSVTWNSRGDIGTSCEYNSRNAAYNGSILSHYVADLSQAMHTDSTSTLGRESSDFGDASSYHSHYEGSEITCLLNSQYKVQIDSVPASTVSQPMTLLGPSNGKLISSSTIRQAIEDLANDTNKMGIDRTTLALDATRQPDVIMADPTNSSIVDSVGKGYYDITYYFYENARANMSDAYGARGYDDALDKLSFANVKRSAQLYGQILYGIRQDAMAMGSADLSHAVPAPGGGGDVLISEAYLNPTAFPGTTFTVQPQWVQICNQTNPSHSVDLSDWTFSTSGSTTVYRFKKGTMVHGGECYVFGKSGGDFAGDGNSIVTNAEDPVTCASGNMTDTGVTPNKTNQFGGCGAYEGVDEAYDSYYTPSGAKFPAIGSNDTITLKDAGGVVMDQVTLGGTLTAGTGQSIKRLTDPTGKLIDTNSASDWVGCQATPSPRSFLPPLVLTNATGCTIAPAAPTSLTATAGNVQVSLSWTASSGAASYNVKRSTANGGPYTAVATSVTATSYTDTGLVNGTTYYYVVTAVNANGESGNSNQASATPTAPDTTPPTAPTLTSVAPPTKGKTSQRLNLMWTASTDNVGVTGYEIYRATGACTASFSLIATATASPYTNTGLTSGTTYCYYLVAKDAAGNRSAASNQMSGTAK